MRVTPGMSESDVIAAVTTVSFDIAGLELYLPLLVGARIELVAREAASDGAALARLLDSAGITIMQATPATWRLLIDAGWRGRARLKALCGGEALSRKLADEILDRVAESGTCTVRRRRRSGRPSSASSEALRPSASVVP